MVFLFFFPPACTSEQTRHYHHLLPTFSLFGYCLCSLCVLPSLSSSWSSSLRWGKLWLCCMLMLNNKILGLVLVPGTKQCTHSTSAILSFQLTQLSFSCPCTCTHLCVMRCDQEHCWRRPLRHWPKKAGLTSEAQYFSRFLNHIIQKVRCATMKNRLWGSERPRSVILNISMHAASLQQVSRDS